MPVRFITIVAVLVAAVAIPGVAQAAPPVRFEVTESGSRNDCGFTIEFERTISHQFLVREVRGSEGQAFLGQDNFQFQVVYTNPVTGAFMVERGRATFKELTARHVAGDIWEFTAHEVGHFVIVDSEGNIVASDSGRVTLRVLFDTFGDSQPSGETLEVEVTGEHGRHFDFCAIATKLIG
jgi:hypothetical protein